MIPDCSRCGHAARYHGRARPICDIRGCRCTSYDRPDDIEEDDEETIADAEAHREDWQDYLEFQRTSH